MKEAKAIKAELSIVKSQFKDENGVLRDFPAFSVDFCGEKFSLFLRDNDKKLFNYLLKKEGFYDEE